MPNFKHVVTSNYAPTFRTRKIEGIFDISPEEKLTHSWDVNIPIDDKEWQIGLIIGASGSGKTTIGRRLFGEKIIDGHEWSDSKSFIDSYAQGLTVDEISKSLSSVGFSSVPSWFLPYRVLSNGQKFRADLSRAILENDFIVIDEFTSVVDRTVAKAASVAVSKYVRSTEKKFVAITCHYDVEEYLQPDWVFDVGRNEFKWGCLRRKDIEIKIRPAERWEWNLFRQHHYLNTEIAKSARCFVAEHDGTPVGFTSYIHFPHPKERKFKREHRTVVLPDFQGLGIGVRLSDFLGGYVIKSGHRFISVTSHPAMIGYRNKSSKWRLISFGRKRGSVTTLPGMVSSQKRNTCSFEFVGDKNEKA